MSIFNKIFSSEGANIVEAVGSVLDEVITTKEEKKILENEELKAEREYNLDKRKLGIQEQEIYVKDTQSARDNETQRDESENSSFLSKNIHEMIALIFVVPFVVSWFISEISLPEIAGQAVMLILGYLYGRTQPNKK